MKESPLIITERPIVTTVFVSVLSLLFIWFSFLLAMCVISSIHTWIFLVATIMVTAFTSILIGVLFSSLTSFLKIYPHHIAVHNLLGRRTKIISPTDITTWQEISTGKYTATLAIWTHIGQIDPRIYNTKQQNLLKELLEEWQPQQAEKIQQERLKQAMVNENDRLNYWGWLYVFVVGCICIIGGIYGIRIDKRGRQKIPMSCVPVVLETKPHLTNGKSPSVIFRPPHIQTSILLWIAIGKNPKLPVH